MKTTQKGFIVPLLLALVAVLVLGGGAYVYVQNNQTNQPATATSTTQILNVNNSVPTINSVATSTDHDSINVIISGSNFTDFSIVEYLSNGKHIVSYCGYLGSNGALTHSWSEPEGGWIYNSSINQLRVINADCRTVDAKLDFSIYPKSAVVSIRIIKNLPTLK